MWLFHVNMASRLNKLFSAGGSVAVVDILALLSGLCFLCAPVRAEIRTAVIDKQTGQLSVIEGYREDFVAWANFTDDIQASGWADCSFVPSTSVAGFSYWGTSF